LYLCGAVVKIERQCPIRRVEMVLRCSTSDVGRTDVGTRGIQIIGILATTRSLRNSGDVPGRFGSVVGVDPSLGKLGDIGCL
jgi:hypothetical protein